MAYTLTRVLKLRVDSNLTSSAKYNLEKLDTLGTTSADGDAVTTLAIQSLENKTIDASLNTITNIDGSAVDPTFGNQIVSTSNRFRLNNGTWNTDLQYAASGQVANLLFRLPANYGTAGQILSSDGAGILSWSSAGAGTGDVKGYSTAWLTADGPSKTVTHSLSSTDVDVAIIDLDTNELIGVDSIVVTGANALSLTASEAPASSWRVVVQAK